MRQLPRPRVEGRWAATHRIGPSGYPPDVLARWLPVPLGNCPGLGPSAGLCPCSLVTQRCLPVKAGPVDGWAGGALGCPPEGLFSIPVVVYQATGEAGVPGLGSEHQWWGLPRRPGSSHKTPSFSWSGVGHSLVFQRTDMPSTASQDAWGPSTALSKRRCSGGFCKGLCLEKQDLLSLFSGRFFIYAKTWLRA